MLNKDLCKQCENLLEYVMEYGTGNANMARCIFGISDLTILKCSHFKKKIALDKQLRTDIKKSLSHGKNPRKQPDGEAWKKPKEVAGGVRVNTDSSDRGN